MKVRQLGFLVLLLGCSGADGDGAPPDFFIVDQEVVDTDRAPNDTDAPLNDSESGSDTDRAENATDAGEPGNFTPQEPDPNAVSAECAAFCQRYTDAGCEAPQCVAGCVLDRCRAQLIRMGDCAVETNHCPESPNLVSVCPKERADYAQCSGADGLGGEPMPMNPPPAPDPSLPPGCTPDTGCDCGNQCDACLCAVDASAADVCDQYCQ